MTSSSGAGAVVVVGGGLAGSLLAARLCERAPAVDLLLLEAGSSLGGEHTWSFHGSDLAPSSFRGMALDPGFVRGLASARWDQHQVRFPGSARTLSGAYYTVRSHDLHAKLAPRLGRRLRLNTPVASLSAKGVTLASGEEVAAALVVDARGPRDLPAGSCAWQTFFGLFVETGEDHGMDRPVLMDATVPQRGGYRFIYVLPFGPRSLLVEDTRYSEHAGVDEDGARAFIPGYLKALGVTNYRETAAEAGSLPIPFACAERPRPLPGTVGLGVAAGLYHPTTGYSLRAAALAADLFAQKAALGALGGLAGFFDDFAAARWQAGGFYRRLNNMLFMAAAPAERWRVMEKFYRLGEGLVERFYAQELTGLDRVKILSGKPPVPLVRGLRAFFARDALA